MSVCWGELHTAQRGRSKETSEDVMDQTLYSPKHCIALRCTVPPQDPPSYLRHDVASVGQAARTDHLPFFAHLIETLISQ